VNYVENVGTAQKRTFGVVGLWHRDRGNTALAAGDTVRDQDPITPGTQDEITNVQPVPWSPTYVGGPGSTASCWMGLRSHGDFSTQDKVTLGGTGNYFNADLMQFQGNNGFNQIGSVHVNGTDNNFPGYGSQMDQMLYRDISVGEGGGLNVSFNFSTNISLLKNTTAGVAVGWFDKDPLSSAQVGVGAGATPSNDGNFIASQPGATVSANAPCDSFMVYIGAPVNDNNVTFTDDLELNTGAGLVTITTVYDKKRRWFSEVLRCTQAENAGAGKVLYKELASYAGLNAPTAVSVDVKTLYPTLYNDVMAFDGGGNGGKFRLVFRVKTNRGFDDQNTGNPSSSFDSDGNGAAILDNVVVNGWAAAEGNFENETGTGAINNDTAVDPLNAWKSTGKPPAVYFHIHPLSTLAFNDPCGGVDNPNRQCNLYGNIVTAGDHDAAGDKEGGVFGSNLQDRARWLATPVINLRSTGNGQYNAMGIDAEIAVTNDYNLLWSMFNGGLVNATTATGNFISGGCQSYPARQVNGSLTWGDVRMSGSIFFYGTRGCFETFAPIAAAGGFLPNSLVRTSNASGVPDSMRAYINRIQRCYSFTVTDPTCSPTTPPNTGVYIDNASFAFIDAPPPPGISLNIWDLLQDAFPANGTDALVPADFDTCAAQIRNGLNRAAGTGSTTRPAITGDTTVVTAAGAGRRMDMVFRILPGVGNYVTKGNRASGVSKRPDVAVPVAATSGDGTFFGEYMANAGAFTSSGSHVGHEGNWSPHKWNSARMDTVESNLFPTANNNASVGLTPGLYAGMYHESDPHFLTLGITKFRCAMTNPAGLTNSTNILCDGTNYASYGAGSGFPAAGAEFPGSLAGQTKEYTKIIPDGLLTPGAHVEYFFRKSDDPAGLTSVELGPDTNFVFQGTEASSDAHRWQEFSVLPDRWKDGAWAAAYQNASAPACMLYIDWEDRRGDETFWVGIADTIGATTGAYAPCPGCVGADAVYGRPTGRWGAHNGWHASGSQAASDVLNNGPVGQDPTIAVYKHGGQPGTIWDMFGVKASESSSTGVSLASRTTTNPGGFQVGKKNLNGPSAKMLRTYYRVLLILTGDLGAGNIGPYADRGDNDVGLLQDFATTVDGTTRPRGVWVQGRAFVEGQQAGGLSGHVGFTTTYFGAGLASGDYRSYAGNSNDIPDLLVFAPVHSPVAPNVTPTGPYGVLSSCVIQDDVITLSGTFGAAMAAKYEDTGTNANPKIASIYAPSSLPGTNDHPMVTVVDGFRVQSLGTQGTLQSGGLMLYYWHVIKNAFGSLNCSVSAGQPVAVGDGPNGLVNFLALRSENPFRSDVARIEFGLTKTEKVELKVYDVTGRLVKTLANREYKAGQHPIFWDGTNDDGQRVARGVYFYQLRTPSFASEKKLVVLKD